jgi:hypothetical protein
LQWRALNLLWRSFKPFDGSRLRDFQVAYLRVAKAAGEMNIGSDVFNEWSDGLRFIVDDGDDHNRSTRETSPMTAHSWAEDAV